MMCFLQSPSLFLAPSPSSSKSGSLIILVLFAVVSMGYPPCNQHSSSVQSALLLQVLLSVWKTSRHSSAHQLPNLHSFLKALGAIVDPPTPNFWVWHLLQEHPHHAVFPLSWLLSPATVVTRLLPQTVSSLKTGVSLRSLTLIPSL